MASYLAIQLVMTVSLLSPSMSGNVRIRWKTSSGQHGVLSRQCLAKFGSAENYHQFNTVFHLVNVWQSSEPLKILSSGQYGVLSRQCLIKFWSDSVLRMRSSLVVRASDCQCTSSNGPRFDPSIRRHSGIWGAADEAVLDTVRKKKKKKKKSPPQKKD